MTLYILTLISEKQMSTPKTCATLVGVFQNFALNFILRKAFSVLQTFFYSVAFEENSIYNAIFLRRLLIIHINEYLKDCKSCAEKKAEVVCPSPKLKHLATKDAILSFREFTFHLHLYYCTNRKMLIYLGTVLNDKRCWWQIRLSIRSLFK